MQGACNGNTYADTIQCVACASCSVGQYRGNLSLCNGSTTQDTVQCQPCRRQCKVGEYIFGQCTGTASFDQTFCATCKECARDFPNQYNSIYRSCNGSDTQVLSPFF